MTMLLYASISRLFSVFGKYPANRNMRGSPLYDELDSWNNDLTSKPLSELTEDDLSRFTGKAITTWGDVDDYKHFLPRIFQLIAEYKPPYILGLHLIN